MLDEALHRASLVVEVADEGRGPDDHDRPVVHRRVELGSCEHDCVDQGDGHADGGTFPEGAEQPARHRAVEHEPITVAAEGHRDDEGLPVDRDAHVCDERLVEDRVRAACR